MRAGTVLSGIAVAILLVLTAWALQRLAQTQTTAHLRDHAAHALALTATGGTPYRWQFRDAADLIAGRVFGADSFGFRDGALTVRTDGTPFEIGLPLAHALDLQRFPQLHIRAGVDVPAIVQIVARQSLDSPAQISAAATLQPGVSEITLNLASIAWSEGSLPINPPPVASMLRLRVHVPASHWLHLQRVTLERIAAARRLDLTHAPRIVVPGTPPRAGSIAVYRLADGIGVPALQALRNELDIHTTPLILLPQIDRVEQQLLQRDRIFATTPAAIAIPAAALDASFAQAREEAVQSAATTPQSLSRWLALGLFAALLIAARLRPLHWPRLRALLEITLVLSGPLWLIVGEHFTGVVDAAQTALIGLSAIYAISLGWPRTWKWNGSGRAWWLAAGVVAVAALIGIALHRPGTALRTIGASHVARYLGWALLQQFLICAICTQRWRIVTGNRMAAVYLGALGFALLHTPNATLMLATFCGGLCWCALYLRERALLPLAASHAASALVLVALLPADILLSAEVSARFFQ